MLTSLPRFPTTRKGAIKLPYLKLSDAKKKKKSKVFYKIITFSKTNLIKGELPCLLFRHSKKFKTKNL